MHTSILNIRLCASGTLSDARRLVISPDSGRILAETGFIGGDAVDLEDAIVAPGFLELQTNGVDGFHFTHFAQGDEAGVEYERKLERTARWYVKRGVTGFWATVPTVEGGLYRKILPHLQPRDYPNAASLLGAHVEGPYLAASKKGAHNASLFQPTSIPPTTIYGPDLSPIKLATVAAELPGADTLIRTLTTHGIRVSLGHSAASYGQGVAALSAGASSLTHTLNAMTPLHHRAPGLAGLITLPEASTAAPPPPYYTLLADGVHVHPSVATLLHRAAPHRSILISDSIELAGLPDGVYSGHAQIAAPQRKQGGVAYIDGTETLVGSCGCVDDCVKNLVSWSGCEVAEAVRCVTENVAGLMGLKDRGRLVEGARADFVVLEDDGTVVQTWVAGRKVWERDGGYVEE